jgi:microcystin degradation protein MlrC
MHARRLPFLIPLNAQSTWMEPAQGLYDELVRAGQRAWARMLSFCMGFPAADFDECAPMVWGHGERAHEAVERLYARAEPPQWQTDILSARDAVTRGWRWPSMPPSRWSLPTRRTTPAPAATATPPACCMRCWPRAPGKQATRARWRWA